MSHITAVSSPACRHSGVPCLAILPEGDLLTTLHPGKARPYIPGKTRSGYVILHNRMTLQSLQKVMPPDQLYLAVDSTRTRGTSTD